MARTTTVGETRDLAAGLAALAQPGDLLLLVGDLGAGKTAFAQGFGAGLGVTEPITSPTFTLANEYDGRLRVHHLDVYRLDQLAEVADLGLAELLDDGGVVLIEWGDAILPVLPNDYLEVRIGFPAGPEAPDDERLVVLRSIGVGWAHRQASLLHAVEPWAESLATPTGDGGTGAAGPPEEGPC